MEGFYQGKVYGNVANRLLANDFNTNALRTNDTLRKDEWKFYDIAIIKEAQLRLNGVADLISRGLTFSVAGGFGKTVLEYEDQSDINDASVSMDGLNSGPNDRPEYDLKFLPLPITHKDFFISARILQASRTTGQSLDTTWAELAARKVSEKLETYLFQGSGDYTFGGGTIFGYTDFPDRNTGSLTADWALSTTTGAEIITDVLAMKQTEIDDRFFGPYVLYIPTAYETKMDEDYKADGDQTIRERILAIANISDVRVSDFMPANNVVLVQMTQDVVRMVEGMPFTNVQWETQGSMMFHMKVMTINVPQIRADQAGRCGLANFVAA